jgi:pimeloyl-ACP methyl ester carboxylesterase
VQHVTSADGTPIAYERTGSGPPLVLVHGSLNDHNIWSAVLPAFAERFTVYAMDRRGRGESGPPAEHALERELEDVRAVIEAAGAPVDLVGHSYGAHCALGAAAMAPEQVKHLVLYEPPTIDVARRGLGEAFSADDPSEAVAAFMEHIGLRPDEVTALKATPFFGYLASFARTMPHEAAALGDHGFDPARFESLSMPALFLVGSITQEHLGEALRQLKESSMPHAEWVTFEGQGHGATLTAPKQFTDTVLEFLAR